MNRCQRNLSLRLAACLLVISTLSLLSFGATAQNLPRQFPDAALRGVLRVLQPPDIAINGQPERLSPGARIRGANNLLVMSGALIGQEVLVNYLREPGGAVREVWILTAEEASQERKGMEPVTNFVFGSDADKPRVDDGKTPFHLLPKYQP